MTWIGFPAETYLLKVINRNTRTRCEICSKLTITTPERCQWRRSGVFIVSFEHLIPCSSVSTANFEHAVAGRVNNNQDSKRTETLEQCWKTKLRMTLPLLPRLLIAPPLLCQNPSFFGYPLSLKSYLFTLNHHSPPQSSHLLYSHSSLSTHILLLLNHFSIVGEIQTAISLIVSSRTYSP